MSVPFTIYTENRAGAHPPMDRVILAGYSEPSASDTRHFYRHEIRKRLDKNMHYFWNNMASSFTEMDKFPRFIVRNVIIIIANNRNGPRLSTVTRNIIRAIITNRKLPVEKFIGNFQRIRSIASSMMIEYRPRYFTRTILSQIMNGLDRSGSR